MIFSGIGIAPADQEKLFEHFSQIDNSYTREAEGTGLGLAIAKRITGLFNGDLSVRSEPGKGSTFTATFDISFEQTKSIPVPVATNEERLVLIMDRFIERAEVAAGQLRNTQFRAVLAVHNTVIPSLDQKR